MSFYREYGNLIDSYDSLRSGSNIDLGSILYKDSPILPDEYAYLLSDHCTNSLEDIAHKAHTLTVQNFGKVIQLYTPLYLSNYCINRCLYCNFNASKKIPRTKLSSYEIEQEAQMISEQGFRHILILTGEDRENSPLSYIKDATQILKKYFNSISIEIYPLEEDEYRQLIDDGIDGLTLYQEAYNKGIYDSVHQYGPKRDYIFRLNAPERAAKAGMRTINIGPLLGLNDFRYESFAAGLHAKYLQDKYTSSEISVSFPRLRPYGGVEYPAATVTDKNLVQIVTALRIFLPRVGITLSTREDSVLRDNLIPLGITRMSAGSSTRVGGRIKEEDAFINEGQFDISDTR
ncbi:2-iminoacetate synthase ThiH, partial [Candidatus Omnitrophota bacterium]